MTQDRLTQGQQAITGILNPYALPPGSKELPHPQAIRSRIHLHLPSIVPSSAPIHLGQGGRAGVAVGPPGEGSTTPDIWMRPPPVPPGFLPLFPPDQGPASWIFCLSTPSIYFLLCWVLAEAQLGLCLQHSESLLGYVNP